jgi:hypothetical protein
VPRPNKSFVDKEHQLAWMDRGGATAMNAMQPAESKVRGGSVSGTRAAESGRLAEAGLKGAARAREIAEVYRAKNAGVT